MIPEPSNEPLFNQENVLETRQNVVWDVVRKEQTVVTGCVWKNVPVSEWTVDEMHLRVLVFAMKQPDLFIVRLLEAVFVRKENTMRTENAFVITHNVMEVFSHRIVHVIVQQTVKHQRQEIREFV